MTHYTTLGVNNNCSDTEIKQAYRALSFKYHPDRNKDADASEKMQHINEAYETLSDKQRRKQYDLELSGVNPMDQILNDIFNGGGLHNLFHGMNVQHGMGQSMGQGINVQHGMGQSMGQHGIGRGFRGAEMHHINIGGHPGMFEVMFTNEMPSPMFKPVIPPILEKKINITFEDAFKGNNIPIVFERDIKMGNVAYTEEEKIYHTIQSGIDDGEIIIIKDKGHVINDIKGDLKLYVHISPHKEYERRGLNIHQNQTISFKESICGFERVIKHIDGTNMRLVSSRGNIIQNGDNHVIKNKGFTRETQVGDLIIIFKVIAPKTLSEDQLKLFDNILL
jgi:DnaJ-class molecular chaperone